MRIILEINNQQICPELSQWQTKGMSILSRCSQVNNIQWGFCLHQDLDRMILIFVANEIYHFNFLTMFVI